MSVQLTAAIGFYGRSSCDKTGADLHGLNGVNGMNGLHDMKGHLGVQDYVRMVLCSKTHYVFVTDLPRCSYRGEPATQYFCEAL